jgi:phosphoribosyl-AMP cyclohydrolase
MPSPTRRPDMIEEFRRFTPRYDAEGLIPCIAVDAERGDVVMMAWMNAEALAKTLETGLVHYYSRSRRKLWRKGEASGAVQRAVEIRTDCDQDVLLVRAVMEQRAGACHTGRETCFYRSVPLGPGPIERDFAEG